MRKVNSGKVRDIYEIDDNSLMIVVSNRVSAFDNIMPQLIPQKGIILNQLSAFWFDLVKDIVPNHIISTNFQDFPLEFQKNEFMGRSMWVKKLKMLPIECIVRGYITGSSWKEYKESGKICGINIPLGMKESEKFTEPLFTPSTKAELGKHDKNIPFREVNNLLGEKMARRIKDTSIAVYEKCANYALERGIILADTKLEFGMDKNGELVIGDELLTPDSSRFWSLNTYEVGKSQDSLDKQYLRDWLKSNGYEHEAPAFLPQEVIDIIKSKYLDCYTKITGDFNLL